MQRKVFRIEQMAGQRRAAANARTPTADRSSHTDSNRCEPGREFDSVRETLAANMRALHDLLLDGKERRMARAAGELGSAVEAMEKATHQILQSAEVIEDCAKALASARKSDYEGGLTQDIQDHLVRIYEACNFQDLAGQRIGKVIGTLALVEQRVAGLVERGGGVSYAPAAEPQRGLLNGPKLDGDTGHASQRDVDALFS